MESINWLLAATQPIMQAVSAWMSGCSFVHSSELINSRSFLLMSDSLEKDR